MQRERKDKERQSQVDKVYMDSCQGNSSSEMLQLCEFSQLVMSKRTEVEKQEWFSEWQQMGTKMGVVPDFFVFMDEMVRTELVNVFWEKVGKSGFISHMLEFLAAADFGKIVQDSKKFIMWKKFQENQSGGEGGEGGDGGGKAPPGGQKGKPPGPPGPPGPPPIPFGDILDSAEEFANIALDILNNIADKRKKREVENYNELVCNNWEMMPTILFQLKDGVVFNPALMKNHKDMKTASMVLIKATTAELVACFSHNEELFMYIPTMQTLAWELTTWIKIKRFEDSFDISTSTDCDQLDDENECGCECDKQNKVDDARYPYIEGILQVKLHKMFSILSLLDTCKVEKLGDVLEWFVKNFLKVQWSN